MEIRGTGAEHRVRTGDLRLGNEAARHALSFWDALIVRSALAAGCSILFSEDMKQGQSYDGVMIENPFSR